MSQSIAGRIARLPATAFQRRLLLILGAGEFIEGMDVFSGGFITPSVIHDFQLSVSTGVLFVSISFFLGSAFGGIIWGYTADKWGRKLAFQINLAISALASLAAGLSFNLWLFAVFRFISGIGVGAERPVLISYLSEFRPANKRGSGYGWMSAFGNTSSFFAAVLGLLFVPTTIVIPGWRYILIVIGVGAIIAWVARRYIPESPRWLEVKGRQEEANKLVSQIEETVKREAHLTVLPEPLSLTVKLEKRIPYREIFSGIYRKRTIILCIMQFFYAGIFYGFTALVPIILVSEGIRITTTLQYSLIIYIGYPIGAVLSVYYADRFDRKYSISVGVLILAALGVAFGYSRDPVLIIVFGFLFTVGAMGWVSLIQTYTGEGFPTRARGTGVSVAYGLSRVGTAAWLAVLPPVLDLYGPAGVFVATSTICVALCLDVALFGPRVKDLTIEAISEAQEASMNTRSEGGKSF